MGSPQLDAATIEALIAAACDTLEGEYLLVGGALVALWLEPRRVTEDVDLVPLSEGDAHRLALMELAEAQGLAVDAVNSAADYFVRRIDGWRDEIEVLREGSRARVYRPTPTLFLLLKCARLSEQDLADCMLLLDRVRSDALALDRGRVLQAISEGEDDSRPGRSERAKRLREALRE